MNSGLHKGWYTWLPSGEVGCLLRRGRGPIAKRLETAFAAGDLRATPGDGARAARDGAGVYVAFDGDLRSIDDEIVGTVSRELNTTAGEALHREWRIGAHLTGEGRGRRALISTVSLYEDLGIETIYVEASEVGRYAWAAAGFDFLDPKGRAEVLDSIRPMALQLGHRLVDSDLLHSWSVVLLDEPVLGRDARAAQDPAMHQYSELTVGDDEYISLGKALLLSGDCAPWTGVLRLGSGEPGRDRFSDYSLD